MEIISDFDIIVVGAGAAGLRAAIAAAVKAPELKIALISKVYPVRSHSVAAEGGIAASVNDDDSPDLHAYDTVKGSDYLADQDAVEFFVDHCCDEVYKLDQWGCPWSRDDQGKIAVRAFGGMNRKRAVFATDKTGFYILHTLYERSLKYKNIKRFDEWQVTELFTTENKVNGLFAYDKKTGQIKTFKAKSIVMAAGGPGQLYAHTTNSAINTGDGMALALRAGASLKDMEFVQFHPTSLPGTHILITEAARAEGGHLINNKGERFLINYLPDKIEMGPRDMITRAIINEYRADRGIKGPHGLHMLLDLRHLGKIIIKEKLPQVANLAKTYMNIDPATEPIPVTPAQHYFMGGIHTNKNAETDLTGLYASGENSCTSINGANRLGSNSLAKCLIFGKVSGENAATYAQKAKHSKIDAGKIDTALKKITEITENRGDQNVFKLTKVMQKCMDTYAGIHREEKSLYKGFNQIKKLREKAENIQINQKNTYYNNELANVIELKNMLQLCETIFISALQRKESRGSHYREDHPRRNDQNYLLHYLTKLKKDTIKINELPVVITKWKPEKRTY